MMSFDTVKLEKKGAVALITFNRPEEEMLLIQE